MVSVNSISFKGIKEPYRKNGYKIKPISKDYSTKKLQKMTTAVRDENFLGTGLNGMAYSLGSDLVIKTTRPDSKIQDAAWKEAESLDKLYEIDKKSSLKFQNSQKGIIAFIAPNGQSYLVSTKVKGGNANYQTYPLNKSNLSSLMKILTSFDKGTEDMGRILPYDYSIENIKFTKHKAGILDFEYLEVKDIKSQLDNIFSHYFKSTSPHISATSNLDSNVSTFEYNCFYNYLTSLPNDEDAKVLFREYLKLKGKYHGKMAKFYRKNANLHPNILKLAEKEKNHSEILSAKIIDADIVEAEARKIQMSRFLADLYDAAVDFDRKISPMQISHYYKLTCRFFDQALAKAISSGNRAKARYFHDCKNLMETWSQAPVASRVWVKNKYKTNAFFIRTLENIIR